MHTANRLIYPLIAGTLWFLSAMLAAAATPTTERLVVPIKLDFPLLQHLMRNQLFDSPDGSAEILHDPAGCSRFLLSDPLLREQQRRLLIEARVEAEVGTTLLGTCTRLFDWHGRVEFLTEPVILAGARAVRLNIVSTRLYDPQGRLINSGRLWELANSQLQSLLSPYQVDLAPAIDQLDQLLPGILSRHSAQQLSRIAQSLSLKSIGVAEDGIAVEISLLIDRLPPSPQQEAVLSAAELQKLEARWQMMDAMLTFAVKHYAATTRLAELRTALLEILLDARYRLRDALAQPVSRQQDPVRHWFIDSWQRLGPVIRRIGLEDPAQDPMLLVSLLTANDALAALDRLGPSIGLEISVDGLRRLGRLLIDQPGVDPLYYDEAVDPELRRLFKLPPSPEPDESSGFNIDLWPIGNAWAGSVDERLKLWVPDRQELPQYLDLMQQLLMQSAGTVAKQEDLPASRLNLYQHLVLTTAWQESCWRQFVIEKDKVVPLRSGSGDVGLMQVNERVWRGFYDLQKLRWDIRYNADAGAEILLQYLLNHALKKGEHKHNGGADNLARASYAAYNGGPGAIARYRNPKTSTQAKKIDNAFWKKYRLVKQGKALQVADCLGGDAAKPASLSKKPTKSQAAESEPRRQATLSKQNQPKPSISAKSVALPKQRASDLDGLGKSWILAQPKHHFTLQLAVFSSLGAAQRFRADTPLSDIVAIAPLARDKAGQFVVLSGSYPTRAAADQAKQRHKKLKPWVRPFQDVQAALQ
ncbi:MAG: transglycosylase SLT domain-containing protein [Chromatiales bacterium]|jgi:septal ring-binding cell division protein DamX